MKKTILQESDTGIIYQIEKIPNTMFHFYILKKRTFKDNTHLYQLCAGLSNDSKQKLVLGTIRGHKTDAVKQLETIIKTY